MYLPNDHTKGINITFRRWATARQAGFFGVDYLWSHPSYGSNGFRRSGDSVDCIWIIGDRSETEIGQTSVGIVLDEDVGLKNFG